MLAEDGLAAIRDPRFDQHPLFPLAIRGVYGALTSIGFAEAPLTWQRAGQTVTFIAGMALIGVIVWLTIWLSRGLAAAVHPVSAAACAALLAALLPLNVWLSADVMSDQLAAVFYLLGAVFLTRLTCSRMSLLCGLSAGFAFAVRPEGATVVLAGFLVLISQWRQGAWRFTKSGVALAVGFLMVAAPYWTLSGKLSAKEDKQRVEEFSRAAAIKAPIAHAALTRKNVGWSEAVILALYHVFRAGRVGVILLALIALAHFRRSWAAPPLLGPLACVAGHFALVTALQTRHGYLDPRHTLMIVLLLIPFAGMFLACIWEQAAKRHMAWAAALVSVAVLAPLALYAARVPNEADASISRMAAWLRAHEPLQKEMRLLGGASERRIAFYADLTPHAWAENLPTLEQRVADLRREILESGPGYRPDFFAIETGSDDERRDNAEIVSRLQRDPAVGPRLTPLHIEPRPEGQTRLFRVSQPHE